MPIDGIVVAEGLETSAGLILLAKKIVDGVKKVIRFKKECRNFGRDATRLSQLLEKHKASVEKLYIVDELRSCLSECLDFIIQCQSWATFTVAWEVACRHRYPKLKQQLEDLVSQLNTEVNVRALRLETANVNSRFKDYQA